MQAVFLRVEETAARERGGEILGSVTGGAYGERPANYLREQIALRRMSVRLSIRTFRQLSIVRFSRATH